MKASGKSRAEDLGVKKSSVNTLKTINNMKVGGFLMPRVCRRSSKSRIFRNGKQQKSSAMKPFRVLYLGGVFIKSDIT